MRVLLVSFGSTGDIFPLIGFGRSLRAAGHEVRYATSRLYQGAIESAGLSYVHLPPDWEKAIFVEFMRELNRHQVPLLQLRHIYDGATPFMAELFDKVKAAIEVGTDVVVGSYFFPHVRYFAERAGAAYLTFAFCHNLIPTEARPPEGFPRLRGAPKPLQRWWHRLAWKVGDWAVDVTLRGAMAEISQRHQVPAKVSFILAPAERCLVGVSPILGAAYPCADRFRYVGFQRWQSPEDPVREAELKAFTQGEEVPVINFGSVAFDNVHRTMVRFLKHWPRGKKVIIQSGWAGLSFSVVRPEVKLIGDLSHDCLFRFASVVIHHGGAGTTASVLYSGKPHIVVPHIADQHWWASEICRQKVGRRLPKHNWPERLIRCVRRIERNPLYRQNSERLAARLSAEPSEATAIRELEDFVRDWKGRHPVPAEPTPPEALPGA